MTNYEFFKNLVNSSGVTLLLIGLFIMLLVVLSFLMILFLAKPDKEVSFYGVKFHKREIRFPFYWFRRYPKTVPGHWIVVFKIFKKMDKQHIETNNFYYDVSNELKVRASVDEMIKHGLLRYSFNHLSLTSKGLEKLHKIPM